MFRAAVIGSPISHSRSPVLHNAGYQALGLEGHYGAIDCTAEQLPAVVGGADPAFVGFSVTMPCKFAALSYADTATKRATAIGSANTLVRCDGMWCADNTDVDGVGGALDTLGVPTPHRVVMVGAGGTARAVVWALGFRGCQEVVILNRSNRVGEYAQLAHSAGVAVSFAPLTVESAREAVRGANCVISTVPEASYRGQEDLMGVLATRPVYDVIYDPWPTLLIQRAGALGQPVVGGQVMLAHQAYTQFELFTGQPAPRDIMWEALERSLRGDA